MDPQFVTLIVGIAGVSVLPLAGWGTRLLMKKGDEAIARKDLAKLGVQKSSMDICQKNIRTAILATQQHFKIIPSATNAEKLAYGIEILTVMNTESGTPMSEAAMSAKIEEGCGTEQFGRGGSYANFGHQSSANGDGMITPKEFALGRKRSVPDVKNYQLASFMPSDLGDLSGEKRWAFNSGPLNQLDQPECVGFGLADLRISAPVEVPCTNADGRLFYKMCKDLDGDSEPGSTVHTGAKVLRKLGIIQAYAFANSVEEIVYWVLNRGPVLVGTDWTMDMFLPDRNNVVHPTGKVAGGHCYLINGKTYNDLFDLKCAWGDDWGIQSRSSIAIEDFWKLHQHYGEALAAVELPVSAVVNPQKEGCSTALANLFGLFK